MNKIDNRSNKKLAQYDELIENLEYVMDRQRALEIFDIIGEDIAALDFETTGLDPRTAKVRLSCIYHPSLGIVILDHFFCGSFRELAPHMLRAIWIVYNAKFEVKWFDYSLRADVVDLLDVDFLAKASRGGYPSSLAMMVRRDLGIILEKDEQKSDWSKEQLTTGQIEYAGRDALFTWELYEHWLDKCTRAERDCAYIFQDAVRPTVECEEVGLTLDIEVHEENVQKWEMKQALMLKTLRKWTPERILANPGSDQQVSNLIKSQLPKEQLLSWPKTEKTKGKRFELQQLSLNRKIVGPIAAKSSYPFSRWFNSLIRYRYYRKYLSTYGRTLITKQYLEDRISYRLNIGQAATGRYSSSTINIQNIPRAVWVRRAFKAPNGYTILVIADYKGIEIRILAELSGDEQLLRDAIYGDVHSGSASAIYGIDEDTFLKIVHEEVAEDEQHHALYYFYKEMRSKAKGFTFQNIYGAGALALSIVLKCSVEEAEDALRKWAARYPKAYNYRHVMFDHMSNGGYIPVVSGRKIFVPKADRTLPVAANYGVQGAAADVMYRAMHHCYEERNAITDISRVAMAATVHDEILLAARGEEDIEAAQQVLQVGMTKGWLDIFPDTNIDNLIDIGHGPNWGSKK